MNCDGLIFKSLADYLHLGSRFDALFIIIVTLSSTSLVCEIRIVHHDVVQKIVMQMHAFTYQCVINILYTKIVT